MAEAWWNWKMRLAAGALLLGLCGFVRAQAPSAVPVPVHRVEVQSPSFGALAGRLTDLRSVPLAGVSLVLRHRATGLVLRAVTSRNGVFRFARLPAGEYTLQADDPRLGRGELEGILVTGGAEVRLQAAMRFEPPAPEPRLAGSGIVPPSSGVAPASLATVAPGASRSPLALALDLALDLDRPAMLASLAPQPLRTFHPSARSIAGAQPAETLSPPSALRASLQTQSVVAEPALAAAPPRILSLAQSIASPASPGSRPSVGANAVQPPVPPQPVVAAAQSADPAALSTTTTLTAAQIQSLPAAGRNWQQFLLDTPASTAGASSSQLSYRGSQEQAEVTVDGSNRSLQFGVTAGSELESSSQGRVSQGADRQESVVQSMSQSWNGGRGLGISEAAIHQVTATAGNVEGAGIRTAGGRTGIETERGLNAFHGQGFYFDRQNAWGAQNPFTQWLQNTGMSATAYPVPIPSQPVFSSIPFTPPDHESVWGLGIGSRIRRDKLFWFAALDAYHRNDPGMPMARVPIGSVVQTDGSSLCVGFFCPPTYPQAQLLGAQLNESIPQAYDDYFGLPGSASTLAGLLQLQSLLAPAPRAEAQWVGFARIDWQLAERHHLTVEATGADWNAPGGGIRRVSGDYGSHSFGSAHASQQWLMAGWQAFLTPNLLAVTQASAGRTILSVRPDTPSPFEQAFLAGNAYGQLPQIVVDSRYGFTIGNPARFGQGSYPDEKLYHAQETLDWVHDNLLLKAGFELDHNADATGLLRNQTGTYHYPTVARFISDALAFLRFGYSDALDPRNPHNCDATGKPWYTSSDQLMGLGALPCYSSYSQMMGPANWHLSTNDWAGFTTAQWHPRKSILLAAGLRWEREQLPPPIAALDNPQLPFTQRLPALGNNWGPRLSLALGQPRANWPVLRFGYGMYYGRVENATVEAALTQTGSFKGDLEFFMRPQDDCQNCLGGAPPFPYVFSGRPSTVVMPGAIGFAPAFRNAEVHEAVASVEQHLPGGLLLTAGAMVNLGRRLPIAVDTNLNLPSATQTITYNICDETPYSIPGATSGGQSTGAGGKCGNMALGPIKASQLTLPFYASWPADPGVCPYYTPQSNFLFPGRPCPDYQQITQIQSRANSTYEAATIQLARYGSRGLAFHAHYTYSHAADWNPDGVALSPGNDLVDPNPAYWKMQYGAGNLDVRHSAAAMAILSSPWKLHGIAGRFANAWMLSGVGEFHSGLPYSLRITGSIPSLYGLNNQIVTGLGPSPNGSGGDNLIYGLGNDGIAYNIGRNTFRYPDVWKTDLRLAKSFDLGPLRQLQLLAETFNLFNHQNVTQIETTGYTIENGTSPSSTTGPGTLPSLNFLTGLRINPKTGLPSPEFGQPLTINGSNFYRERQIQLGLRMRF